MKKTVLMLTLVSACIITLPALAETIALWHFNEGIVSSNATTLISEYNPTIMVATAGINAGGPLPYFTEDIGESYLAEGLIGTQVSTNKHSLKFTNTGIPADLSSHKGGILTVPHNAIMVMSNLTVEVFVKIDRLVNYPLIIGMPRAGSDTSWNIDMNNAGQPRVRIDSHPLGSVGTSSNGWNQGSLPSPVAINDGKWHHLAFTYTHATKKAILYVDYQERTSMTSFSNLVYETNGIRIGQGCGGRAFDGWIDEVRISNVVLPPDQFLVMPHPVTETYAYFGFDGIAGTYANKLTNSVFADPFIDLLHGTAGVLGTGVKPMFTNELPSATKMLVKDGVTGETVNSNTTALFFRNSQAGATPESSDGSVVLVNSPTTPDFPTNFTVEAFVKGDRDAKWPQIIGKRRGNAGDFSWSLGTESGKYRCRFDTNIRAAIPPEQFAPGFNQVLNSGVILYDGLWHHIAMTYHSPTKTAKLYVDYELKLTATTTYPVYLDNGIIQIGAGDKSFDGAIDEVRITKRVLEPAEFLYLAAPPNAPGTVILVR